MATNGDPKSSVDYIQHHLLNNAIGDVGPDQKITGFWALELDTIIFGWITFGLFAFAVLRLRKSLTAGTPSGLQSFLELIDRKSVV